MKENLLRKPRPDLKRNKFEQLEYTDEETGLSTTYNLYLPENYDESKESFDYAYSSVAVMDWLFQQTK